MATRAALEETGMAAGFFGPPAFLGPEILKKGARNRLFLTTLQSTPFIFSGLEDLIAPYPIENRWLKPKTP